MSFVCVLLTLKLLLLNLSAFVAFGAHRKDIQIYTNFAMV